MDSQGIPFKFQSHKNYAEVQYTIAREDIIPYVRKYSSHPELALDLGCGQGGATQASNEYLCRTIGLDIEDKNIFRRNFVRASATQLPFCNNFFDVVIMHDIVEHVPDTEMLMRECKRILKPGGILYVTFPPYFFPYSGHLWNLTSKIKYLPYAHLLPKKILYRAILSSKQIGIFHPNQIIRDQETFSKITISKFENLCKKNKLEIESYDFKLSFTAFERGQFLNFFRHLKFLFKIKGLREIVIPFCLFIVSNNGAEG